MKYFFVLGKNEALSVAELSSVLGASELDYTGNGIALFDSGKEIDAEKLIKQLGGTVKIGRVEDKFGIGSTEEIKQFVCDLVYRKREAASGKFKFGISQHGSTNLNAKDLGMEIKTLLKNRRFNSRLVTSKEKNLSSVVVETNKLTDKGMEVVLFEANGQVMVGHTLAVQPFKDLSFRDYGRPARDSRSGMLPPKLARIMINLALEGEGDKDERLVLLDPFCGSGTVLTEAALDGRFSLITGTDVSDQAVKDSEENMRWLISKYRLNGFDYKIFNCDVRRLNQKIPARSADTVVTEPYLGPPTKKINRDKTIKELEQLYSKSLKQISTILKPEGRAVMAWPLFAPDNKQLNPELQGLEILPLSPFKEKEITEKGTTSRGGLIYERPDQRIKREILILRNTLNNPLK